MKGGINMKTMTCRQLGGACDMEFHANTFEELADLSKSHGISMVEQGDSNHMQAMNMMKEKMNEPQAMKQWMDEKKQEFEELPDES